MQSIFTFAVHQNYIKETPCRNVILPSEDVSKNEKRNYMTEDELRLFLNMLDNNCKYPDFAILMKVLLYTGMRSGAALGLQ